MAKWHENDKKLWDNSPVMQELEKYIMAKIKQVDILSKKAQETTPKQTSNDYKELKKSVDEANKSVSTLKQNMKTNMAEDEEDKKTDEKYLDWNGHKIPFEKLKEVLDCLTSEEPEDKETILTEDLEEPEGEVIQIIEPEEILEHLTAKAQLINDLKDMVKKASDIGNTVLAYRIERTIDELLEE